MPIRQVHPPVGKGKPKQYWCPYCAKWLRFKVADDGYKKCEQCGISDSDFHVRSANNLWGNPNGYKKVDKELIRRRAALEEGDDEDEY